MADYICIKTYQNRYEVERDQELLETSGIRAVIIADDLGGIFPSLLMGNPARLMVAEEQVEEARALLETCPG